MNPFTILGVSLDSTPEEIKIKYKQLANIHHPDKGGDEELFKLINLAYEILTDPIKRKSYIDDGIFFNDSSILNDAKHKLDSLFFACFNSFNPDFENIIYTMNKNIENENIGINNQIQDYKNLIFKLEIVRTKIRLKQQTENIIEHLISKRIEVWKSDLNRLERDLKVNKTIHNILYNYHYGDTDYCQLLDNIMKKPELTNEKLA